MYIYYIDPGTGSMLISAAIAMFSVAFFVLKGIVYRKFGIGGDKGDFVDVTKDYGLVYYSEGKQYWNVFKPLVEGCNDRGIKVTYFSSDKEDPGLNVDLPNVDTLYIGSGREAYYVLNRLRCNLLVMTTPGLDVLEIKRSPYVKHYCHVTHSPGSTADYNAYALDYYDSVLIGGTGDIEVIRELEKKRNLKEKEIEIIGHTYLDVLREGIADIPDDFSFFKNQRKTILVSPTWGNHSLLVKYGDKLLKVLTENDKYNVIVRPHPQSFVSDPEEMSKLMEKYKNGDCLVWDRERNNTLAMKQADIMISDFSGIIFDFNSLFHKPILTTHSEYDKRGRDTMDIDGTVWDMELINDMGGIIYESDIENIISIVDEAIENHKKALKENTLDMTKSDLYPNESKERGGAFLEKKLKEIEEAKVSLETTGEAVSNVSSFDDIGDLPPKQRFIKLFTSSESLFQISGASVLLTFYIIIGVRLLPEGGLNVEYLSRLLPYSVLANGVLLLMFLLVIWIKDKGSLRFNKSKENFDLKNMFLTMLPMMPIIQYVILNQDILSTSDSFKVIIYFVGISIALVVVLPWVLSPVLSTKLSVSVTVSFLFVVFNRASFGRTTSLRTITLILMAICIIIFIVLLSDKKKVLSVIMGILLIVNSGSAFANRTNEVVNHTKIDNSNSTLLKMIDDKKATKTPDVFLMVYDAYANEETWHHYDYNNADQMSYLLEEGFTIYDGSYSAGLTSLMSMAHVLNPQLIDGSNSEYRKHIAGEASGLEMFRRNGYSVKSVFDSDYFTKETETLYDFTFPDDKYSIDSSNIIKSAILEGEFRFDIDFSTITYEEYLEVKNNQISKKESKPTFMYFHDKYPGHTQNSGTLLPGERDMIIERLEMANVEMKKNIEILNETHKDAIVIIMGDHGPYLTKNGTYLDGQDINTIDRVDVQDRYGTFLAIKWPDKAYADNLDLRLIQDAIPAVLAYMYDDVNLFDEVRMERKIISPNLIGGVDLIEDILIGGIDDGEYLFEKTGRRTK